MRSIITISLLFLSSLFALAQEGTDVFEQANAAYAEQRYDQAADLYQSLVDKGLASVELYYNLGNCYYKLDDIGSSVLYYEKALKLEPGYEDAAFNLKLANLKVADRVEPLREAFVFRMINAALLTFSSDGWAKLCLIFLWIAFAVGGVFLYVNVIAAKRVLFVFGVLLLLLAIITGFISLRQMSEEKANKEGIIMVMNTYVKSAPEPGSMDLFILREGVKVRLQEQSGEWQQVKIVDEEGDKVGWIKANDVAPI